MSRKTPGKIRLGRSRPIWEDNIKFDVGKIGFEDMDWIQMAQDIAHRRDFMNTLTKYPVP
jgi:hypothetical protein